MSIVALMAAAILVQDLSGSSPATSASVQEPAVALGDVIVEGRRLDELTRELVDAVSAPALRRGLARWGGRVCVGVAKIGNDVAQAVADRVSQVAMAYGLRTGDPGCRPNILVVFTGDGQSLSAAMVEHRRQMFHVGVGGLDRGDVALRHFQKSDRPVRWRSVSLPTNAYTGEAGLRLPGGDAPMGAGEGLVNKGRNIRDDLNKVIVVVDTYQVENLSLPQLADYVAMVSLAQVDPDGDTSGYATILNPFDAPQSIDGLTEWDTSYLTSLYRVQDSPVQRINPSAQARMMAADMIRSQCAARNAAGQAAPGDSPPPRQ